MTSTLLLSEDIVHSFPQVVMPPGHCADGVAAYCTCVTSSSGLVTLTMMCSSPSAQKDSSI